jgi:hypothetical protein
MDRLLGYLRQDFGKRHACLSKQPDGQEVLLFKAMGRNGNWPMEITLEEDGEVMSICSMLPLTITPARRQAIAELVTRLNDAAEEGRFETPDASGRIRYRSRRRRANTGRGCRSTGAHAPLRLTTIVCRTDG